MSVRLYLMRHATAVAHGTMPDAERTLTEEGLLEARAVAKGLKRLKVQPDKIVTSPYVRARQTAEEVRRVLAPQTALEGWEALRFEADPRVACAGLKQFKRAEAIVFVGHEPHMSAWVAQWVDPDGKMQCMMKKAGVACIEVASLSSAAGSGVLRWLMTPKQLTVIGESA